MTNKLPIVVAITGASGSILGLELVKALLLLEQPVEFILTSHAYPVIQDELPELELTATSGINQAQQILIYLGLNQEPFLSLLTCFSNKALGAAPASGTHLTQGMVIVPCSMSTLGKMACGISDNLVCRAADVTLKERRKLIVVPRESPFNRIHLENLLKLHDAGALILPPMLSFYLPEFLTMAGQLAYTTSKILDHLGLTQHQLMPRWGNHETLKISAVTSG